MEDAKHPLMVFVRASKQSPKSQKKRRVAAHSLEPLPKSFNKTGHILISIRIQFLRRGISEDKQIGDEQFWKEKISCSQKAQHACMNGPVFLFLTGGGGWGERFKLFFPLFPMCSHQVPKEFSMCSQ
jgi:hypothetical protein